MGFTSYPTPTEAINTLTKEPGQTRGSCCPTMEPYSLLRYRDNWSWQVKQRTWKKSLYADTEVKPASKIWFICLAAEYFNDRSLVVNTLVIFCVNVKKPNEQHFSLFKLIRNGYAQCLQTKRTEDEIWMLQMNWFCCRHRSPCNKKYNLSDLEDFGIKWKLLLKIWWRAQPSGAS